MPTWPGHKGPIFNYYVQPLLCGLRRGEPHLDRHDAVGAGLHAAEHEKTDELGVRAHGPAAQGAGVPRQRRLAALVPPEAVPREVSVCVHAGVLENGAPRPVRARPPAHTAAQRLGQSGAGDIDFDPAPLRQDHIGLDVCGRDDVCGAQRGMLHLLYVQAHQPQAAAERDYVSGPDLQEHGREAVQGGARQHGGAGAAGPGERARPPRRELVPL